MDSALIKKIDALEEAHQEIKRRWFAWARDLYQDRGIGSVHNTHTVDFLKNEGSDAVAVFTRIKQDIGKDILKIENPKEKYLIYRELFWIHPSFHEHWLIFNLHLELSAKKIISGRGGLNQFLKKPERKPSDLQRIATYSLRRLILIENLLAGQMEMSLFDAKMISDQKLPQMAGTFDNFSQMNISEKVEVLPDIFSVVLTLLEKTNYQSLHPGILLSNAGWTYWAACCINEGPIFKKAHQKSRVEIFRSLHSIEPGQFHKEAEEYYEVVPVSIEKTGGVLPNPCIDLNTVQPLSPIPDKEKKLSDIKVREKTRYSSLGRVKFYEEKSSDSTSAVNLYSLIREKLDPLFGTSVYPQKSKFTYRGKNKIGYLKKAELDMISLFKPNQQHIHGMKYHVYPYVLASNLGLKVGNNVLDVLPLGSVVTQEQENPHPAEIFIKGYFSNSEEVERFVKWLSVNQD